MSVNGYLTRLANNAIIRDAEKKRIQTSISTLQYRLSAYFEDEIDEDLLFGSYSRGTILPRSMDACSDVDYMVIFNDSGVKPQTYLDRLRRFVNLYYNKSEIAQSHPTIALSLNHIRFELVPAIDHWFNGLRIPAKISDYSDWMDTDPTGFNSDLVSKNQSHQNLIKPLVRLVKYWNAQNGYVFESYELEKSIVGQGYWGSVFSTYQLKNYFYDFIESMDLGWSAAQWRKDKVQRAQKLVDDAQSHERQGDVGTAELRIKTLLPPVNSLVGA